MIGAGNILLVGSILLFVSILAGKVSYRFGTPMLLVFLIVGMFFGTDGLGIEFDSPTLAQFIGMIALSIILFSGGMDTKTSEIRPVMAQGIILATVGVLLTTIFTGTFIYWIAEVFNLKLTLTESMLLAAVMSSTDSASVFSILRSKKQGLKENLRPLLELESGSNDPMAYILTILLLSVVEIGGDLNVLNAIFEFVIQMFVGALFGYLFGKLAVMILNRLDIGNKSLYSILLLAVVFFIFSFTDLLNGNGYLAVYIAGLVVGNNKIANKQNIITFFDGITWLVQIVMFLTLGLLVNPHEMVSVAGIGLVIGVFTILLGRPAAVFLSLIPFRKMSFKAKLYVSWVGLRGAVPIIFATYPLVADIDNSRIIFNTVFFITIVSLLVQGTTVSSMARLLGMGKEEKEAGFDINLPDEVKADLTEIEVTQAFLSEGDILKQISLPPDTLIMMVRRGNQYIVPNGDTPLMLGDKLLCISTENQPDNTIIERKSLFGKWKKRGQKA